MGWGALRAQGLMEGVCSQVREDELGSPKEEIPGGGPQGLRIPGSKERGGEEGCLRSG